MAKFKPITENDPYVKFSFEIEAEDMSPIGAFESGDPDYAKQEKAYEREVLERLELGDDTAWFHITVTATFDGHVGLCMLSGCSLLADLDNDGISVAKRVESFARGEGLHTEALADLNEKLLAAHTPRVVRMCKTQASRGVNGNSYVRARHLTTKRGVRQPWDPSLDMYENHAEVAERILGRRPEFSASIDGGGYIFGVDPANDSQAAKEGR